MMQEEQLIQVTDGQLKQDLVISNAVIRPHDQATLFVQHGKTDNRPTTESLRSHR
jgi:hypothetical protein